MRAQCMHDLGDDVHDNAITDELFSKQPPLGHFDRAILIATALISMVGASCARINQVKAAPPGRVSQDRPRIEQEKVGFHGLEKILDKNSPLPDEVLRTFGLAIKAFNLVITAPNSASEELRTLHAENFVSNLVHSVLFQCRKSGISPLEALRYSKRFYTYKNELSELLHNPGVNSLLEAGVKPEKANRYPKNFGADDVVRAESLISTSENKLSFENIVKLNESFQKISSFTGEEVLTFIEGGMDADTLAGYFKALPIVQNPPDKDPLSRRPPNRAAYFLALFSLHIHPDEAAFYYEQLNKTGMSDVAIADLLCLQLPTDEVKGYMECDAMFRSDGAGHLISQLMSVGVSPQRFSQEMADYQKMLPWLPLDSHKIGTANKHFISVAITKKLPVGKVVELLSDPKFILNEGKELGRSDNIFLKVINPCIAFLLSQKEIETLKEGCGIREDSFYRYDAEILKLQAARWSDKTAIDPEKLLVTVAQGTADATHAFFTLSATIHSLIRQGKEVNILEAYRLKQLKNGLHRYRILCGRNNDTVIIGGHGTLYSLALGAENPAFSVKIPTKPDTLLKITDREFIVGLKEFFNPGASLVLVSCSTGGFTEGPKGLAQTMFELLDGTIEVYAASMPTYSGSRPPNIEGTDNTATFLGSPTIVRQGNH